ncbi:MAG: S9 family peptidase [Bdellovibrionales bacterium]|nr:S9 family peptidase [Bdellovibrionales bacterium]
MQFLKMGGVVLLLWAVACSQVACSQIEKQEQIPEAPVPKAKKIHHTFKEHGDLREDPYFWMKNRESKEVLKYIEEENNYSRSILEKSKYIQSEVAQEIRNRTVENDTSVPYKEGQYYYYTRLEKGKQYPIYCRKKGTLTAEEEIYLDVNSLAAGKKFFSLVHLGVSPNGETLAFATDEAGRRFYTLKFKNLKTGEMLKDQIKNVSEQWEWANDNKTGFYIQQNPTTLRSEKVYRYSLTQGKSTPVYHEKDETFEMTLEKSLNHKTIFIHGGNYDETESQYVFADKPGAHFKTFHKRENFHDYQVTDGGDGFYILTNWKAKNFRIMVSKTAATPKNEWREVIPHRSDVYIESLWAHKDYLVLSVRYRGLLTFEVYNKKTKKNFRFEHKPIGAFTVLVDPVTEFDSREVRFVASSLIQPEATSEFNVDSQTVKLLKKDEIPNYEPELYATERLWAKASDGTPIPVTVSYRKSHFRSGTNPLYVYAYGSYGLSSDPEFLIPEVSLLDRGFVYAIAHVRGGMEMGRDWYDNGRMMKKKNTFTDFVEATEHLVRAGYGRAGHVYMEGRSAGGLLVGAVLNLRPDLYHGAHAGVPFVDVVTTMLDSTIPLTTNEYDQWGNPQHKREYDYMKSYSPYDNIKTQAYPHVLITTGFNDPQVQYFEPLKYAAKLRENNTQRTSILLKTDMDVGHFGLTGRYDVMNDQALELGYFIWLEEQNSK